MNEIKNNSTVVVENSLGLLKRLKIERSHDLTISLLDMYLKEMKLLSWQGIYTSTVLATFTIAKIWNQLKCLLID